MLFHDASRKAPYRLVICWSRCSTATRPHEPVKWILCATDSHGRKRRSAFAPDVFAPPRDHPSSAYCTGSADFEWSSMLARRRRKLRDSRASIWSSARCVTAAYASSPWRCLALLSGFGLPPSRPVWTIVLISIVIPHRFTRARVAIAICRRFRDGSSEIEDDPQASIATA